MKSKILALFLLALVPGLALADLNIFACEPEWAALAKALGGDHVRAYSATTAQQDPHHIQARPSLIAKVRRADLVACTGAELEIGWLPVLLQRAGNARVQTGTDGYFEASRFVTMLDVPARLDRAQGDVHPEGNPHIQSDPRNIALVADALAKRMAALDGANARLYRQRRDDFLVRWRAAEARWAQEAAPLRGVAVVTHHKGWAYLIRWLGLREVTTLEPKPGIPPSGAHLAEVMRKLQGSAATMVIHAAYQDPRPAAWLAGRAHIADVTLPFTVGGTDGAQDLFGLFDDTIDRLRKGLGK
jgi:zinc/manganese transport system substrate-binding protein